MDYKDLPLDQRIEQASKYAFLLSADFKSKEEIIDILKQDYVLTEEQALHAYIDRLVTHNRSVARSGSLSEKFDMAMTGMACLFGFLLCVVAIQYFFRSGTIDEQQLSTITQCIITEPVRKKSTGKKQPHRYYVLKLRGHNLDFRFFDDYFEYANDASGISQLKEYDTVSISISKDELGRFNDQYSSGSLEIYNLALNKGFLVDHAYRNEQIIKSHKTNFYRLLIVFAGVIGLILLKNLLWGIFKEQHPPAHTL